MKTEFTPTDEISTRHWNLCRPLKSDMLSTAGAVILAFWPGLSHGSAVSRPICDIAAQRASSSTGVPIAVLEAITRNETGRAEAGVFRPWPWTVNMEGVGVNERSKLTRFQHLILTRLSEGKAPRRAALI